MRLRWSLLLAYLTGSLARKNETVLGVNAEFKATSSLVPTSISATAEASRIVGGVWGKEYEAKTAMITTDQYCPKETATITETDYGYCPGPSVSTVNITITDWKTSTCTEYVTVTNIRKSTETKTDTSTFVDMRNITTTLTAHETLTYTVTAISLVPTTQISIVTTAENASTLTTLVLSTTTLPAYTVLSTVILPPVTSVSTVTLPVSTSISTTVITQSFTTTKVVPTTLVQSLTPSSGSTISCTSDCQIDVTATRLGYPGTVIISTTSIPVVTLQIFTDAAGNDVSSSLLTMELPPPVLPTTLTWNFSGVPLTWPTVYAAYATFSHISVEPVGSECVSETMTLALPSPTDYTPLIVPENEIPETNFVAPTVVSYLNSLETVVAQLGQTIGQGACDPIIGSTADPSTSTLGSTTIVVSGPALGSTVVARLPQAVNAPPPTQAPSQPTVSSAVGPTPTPPSASPSNPSPSPPSSIAPPEPSRPPPPQPTSSARVSSSAAPEPPSIPLSTPAESASGARPSSFSSSLPPAPPSVPGRSTTRAMTSNGTTSAAQPALSTYDFTAAAAYPTANIARFLLGAAGFGLGLF